MRIVGVLAILLLVGCASSTELAQREAEVELLRTELERACERIEELEILMNGHPYRPAAGALVPNLSTKVIAVDRERNAIVISIGGDDRVKVGYEFVVYRGNEYVATLVIDRVESDSATGHSLKEIEKETVLVGDAVTTAF